MRSKLIALFCILTMIGMTSCEKKSPDVEMKPVIDHTLLIYMVGDNNGMSKFSNGNIRSCMEGLLQADPSLQLVIYKDVENHLPELFQLKLNKKNNQKVDTIYIKQYTEYVNSVNKDFLAEVVNAAFEACPAKIKGFEFWSHGGSWIPDGWKPKQEAGSTRASQYIGIDNYRYMQIWEFREALEKCPHLDYITFDACNMATAEIAYELRDRCDYILGSAQEIMGDGFPYSEMIVNLSHASEEGLYQSLCKCVDAMQTLYPNNGSLSLIKSAGMKPLAEAYAALIAAHSDLLNALSEDVAGTIQSDWQHYGGGNATNTIYYYYDLEEVAEYLYGDLTSLLKEVVPYFYCADSYYSGLDYKRYPINRFCGLAVSVPELFHLAKGNQYLQEGYHMTLWGQTMGY